MIYVGKAINLKNRVSSYFHLNDNLPARTKNLVSEINSIDHIVVESELEALLLEAELIKRHKPRYNVILRDDKSYLYIKIDSQTTITTVSTTRREKPKRGVKLFGPFPSAHTARSVLRYLRKIFPFCSHAKKPRGSCLWVDLGLCPGPWQGKISLAEYKQIIGRISFFLSNKKKKLIIDLKKEMVEAAEGQNFEKAAALRNQIRQLEYVIQPKIMPSQYLENPNLVAETVLNKLASLKQLLNLEALPKRIECYDISNISGKQATGSMVVFTDGEKDGGQYRRFRIRAKDTPDDFFMIKEVLSRRFQNDWPLPQLIVIDGGKGQIASAYQVLYQMGLTIPIIGLAKKMEEIYQLLPQGSNYSFVGPIRLKRDHPALRLVQSLRDEAHRFAISYHRHLRSKVMLAKSV